MGRRPIREKTWAYGSAPCVSATPGTNSTNVFLDLDGIRHLHAAVTLALVELQKMNRNTAAGRRARVKVTVFHEGNRPHIMLGGARSGPK